MYIKAQTVIPVGTKITKFPPSNKKVKSLYSLERAHERELEEEAVTKQMAAKVTNLIKAGYSVSEAIKLCNK